MIKRYWFVPILLVQLCLAIYACGSDAVGQTSDVVTIFSSDGVTALEVYQDVQVTMHGGDLGIWFMDGAGNETIMRGLPYKVECVGECARPDRIYGPRRGRGL